MLGLAPWVAFHSSVLRYYSTVLLKPIARADTGEGFPLTEPFAAPAPVLTV